MIMYIVHVLYSTGTLWLLIYLHVLYNAHIMYCTCTVPPQIKLYVSFTGTSVLRIEIICQNVHVQAPFYRFTLNYRNTCTSNYRTLGLSVLQTCLKLFREMIHKVFIERNCIWYSFFHVSHI